MKSDINSDGAALVSTGWYLEDPVPNLSVFLPSKYTKSPAWTHRAQVSLRREVLHRGHRSTATYRPSASSTDSTITQPGVERAGWG